MKLKINANPYTKQISYQYAGEDNSWKDIDQNSMLMKYKEKKSQDMTKMFSLMEYLEFLYSQELPGVNEKSKHDYFSILNKYLLEYSNKYKNDDFKSLLSQAAIYSEKKFDEVQNHYKAIRKYRTKGWLFGKKNLYPLLMESFQNLIEYNKVVFSAKSQSHLNYIYEIIDSYSGKKEYHLKVLKKNSTFQDSLGLYELVSKEKKYSDLEIKNIAVCATMSAGKSTLVNALLGADVLPSRNEVSTAKITTVLDKDGLSHLKGLCYNNEKLNVSYDVDLKTIDDWNSDKNIEHIYLQGDLDGIKNTEKYAVQIHDTPGTNNSIDESHCKITLDFLKPNDLELLIYVANFEQLMTNDEQFLLKEIKHRVIDIRKIPVLFVVNKVDSYDKQKENYEEVMLKFDSNLKSLGYERYEILPVASKVARLIKMALKGKASQFTENECDEFRSCVNKFTKRMNINDISPRKVKLEDSMIYGQSEIENIKVDGDYYETKRLREALVNTGLIGIEKTIEEYIA